LCYVLFVYHLHTAAARMVLAEPCVAAVLTASRLFCGKTSVWGGWSKILCCGKLRLLPALLRVRKPTIISASSVEKNVCALKDNRGWKPVFLRVWSMSCTIQRHRQFAMSVILERHHFRNDA
jgi:hypothetical protein